MSAFPKRLKELCLPARVYFIVSIIALLIMLFQNLGNSRMYRLGTFTKKVSSTVLIFLMKLIYILFWTYVLNLICKDGHSSLSWFLVLLPFVLFFVLLALMML